MDTEYLSGKSTRELLGEINNEMAADFAKKRFLQPDVKAVRLFKIGRNESCPCGSGKKFKKCCWGRKGVIKETLTGFDKEQQK